MEKEFVKYTEALALKELGFDKENCFGWWTYRYDSTEGYLDTLKTYCFQIKDDLNRQCLAPLYQQAFRWFREKHNLKGHIEAVEYLDETPDTYHWCVFDKFNSGYDQLTYEEAELECLKKLIEIVKNK